MGDFFLSFFLIGEREALYIDCTNYSKMMVDGGN